MLPLQQDGPKLAAMLLDACGSTGIACEWGSYVDFKAAMKEYATKIGFLGVVKPQGHWAVKKERRLKLAADGSSTSTRGSDMTQSPSLCLADVHSEMSLAGDPIVKDYLPHGGKFICKTRGCSFAIHFRLGDDKRVALKATSTFVHDHPLGAKVELDMGGELITHEDLLTEAERQFVVSHATHPYPLDIQRVKREMQGTFPDRCYDRRLLRRLAHQEQTRRWGDDSNAMVPFFKFLTENVKSKGGVFQFDVDLYNRITDIVWQYPIMRRYLQVSTPRPRLSLCCCK